MFYITAGLVEFNARMMKEKIIEKVFKIVES